ncbi:MAG: NADH-quinone oxidoreductase subunit N, partial [Armatimonadetes bacterium]|nr:NADH-quinone oxidoreductase subunit N [Armatimonadota bacterium]
ASSNELITLFVSLELVSIPLYILASFNRNDQKSAEAGLKYFLLGALSSGILLYGMSLIYGTLQTTFLTNILLKLSKLEEFPLALILGLIFVLAGLGFKIASAPFHMWAPDVYQGAPTPITAFISIGPKAAGIAVLSRLFLGYFITLKPDWTFILSILSIFSMTIGNLAALSQTNFKRMLAYSGIAQIGYILIGLTSASVSGLSGVLFYILIYALTNLGAFSIIIIYALETGSEEIKDYAGLVKRSPLLASILFLALLSLAGVPPLSGFIGKFYLFTSAFQAKLYFLVFMGIINSVISLYYYLSVSLEDTPLKVNFSFKLALSLALIGIVFLGLYPPLMEAIEKISKAFLLFKVF